MAKPNRPHNIELKLREINQLFNSMDPSPFNEKDLDRDAEDFILGWAQEYPIDEPIKLKIHLEQSPEQQNIKEQITEAVHHYFSYREKLTHLEVRRLFKQARTSLAIGLSFLTACVMIIRIILVPMEQSTWTSLLRESLNIAGWVAMWRPMQMYLYDWWPLMRKERVFERLSKMPIEIVTKKGPQKNN